MRAHRPAVACALALGLAGCVIPNQTRYDFDVDDASRGAPGVRVLLVPPLNFNSVLPEELVDAAERVRQEIRAYIQEEHGRSVLLPSFTEFHDEWVAANQQALDESLTGPDADEPTLGRSIQILADRYAEEQAFDALVVADLVIETVYIVKERAQWDGVSRRMRWVNKGGYHIREQGGSTVGVSLEVTIFDRAGVQVFHNRGGLDLIHEANVRESKMQIVDNPLGNRLHLREGIAIALDPYLPL